MPQPNRWAVEQARADNQILMPPPRNITVPSSSVKSKEALESLALEREYSCLEEFVITVWEASDVSMMTVGSPMRPVQADWTGGGNKTGGLDFLAQQGRQVGIGNTVP